MACGDRYKYLLQVGEHSPAKPCGSKPWCSEADAKIAIGQAQAVFGVVRSNWNALVKHENELQDWAESEKLRSAVETYETDYAKLEVPGWWAVAGADAATAAAWAHAQAGTCIADLLAEALERTGGPAPAPSPPAPPPPVTPADALAKGVGAAVGVALAAGLLVLVFRFASATREK